jgi:epoxyqueuosine reductase QueG
MNSSKTSPPAFHWDEWYNSIGGRRIKIAEVETILNEIKEYQYPRFKGNVNVIRTDFASKVLAVEAVKRKAFELGADEVGIAEIEPSDIYKDREIHEKYAVVVAQKMLWRNFQEVPSHNSAVECLRIYFTLGEVVIQLADYIRSLGYACTVEHPIGDSDVLHVPLALKAGFGELGRHGSIIHPKMGPLFRLGSVITNMNLETDRPIDAGIAAFCDSCRACRIYCPAKAIPDNRSPEAGKDHLGNDRYMVDTGKCFPYFATHNYCSACLPVCVFHHKEWAKDFEGFTTKLFPEVEFKTPPPPVDPDIPKHWYPQIHRK